MINRRSVLQLLPSLGLLPLVSGSKKPKLLSTTPYGNLKSIEIISKDFHEYLNLFDSLSNDNNHLFRYVAFPIECELIATYKDNDILTEFTFKAFNVTLDEMLIIRKAKEDINNFVLSIPPDPKDGFELSLCIKGFREDNRFNKFKICSINMLEEKIDE